MLHWDAQNYISNRIVLGSFKLHTSTVDYNFNLILVSEVISSNQFEMYNFSKT